jgi:hypothetical protein
MFRNSRPICVSPQPCGGQGHAVSHPQIPERSGLPSAVRGAGVPVAAKDGRVGS